MNTTTFNSVYVLLFLMILPGISVLDLQAQTDGDPISIGEYKIVSSRILNEDRRILIHLPRNYKKTSRSYPVFYMLYGNHRTTYFAETVSILDSLGSGGRIPEMILVGIENTDRYRDLLPEKPDGSPSGIDRFLSFFKTELIPFIEKSYRCKNYRLIMGPQAGANFAFYTLFKDPTVFNAAIMTNPFRWKGGRNLMLQQARQVFKKDKNFEKTLFITTNDNDKLEREGGKLVEEFSQFLADINPGKFRLHINHVKNWDEFLAPLGIRPGIKAIFQNYPLPRASETKDLEALKRHYLRLTNEFGYEVDIPEHQTVMVYDILLKEKKSREAMEILTYILETNPNSLNGLWRVAAVHQQKGDLAKAINNLEKMVKLMGSDAGMIKRRLDQLKKMHDDNKKEKQ